MKNTNEDYNFHGKIDSVECFTKKHKKTPE